MPLTPTGGSVIGGVDWNYGVRNGLNRSILITSAFATIGCCVWVKGDNASIVFHKYGVEGLRGLVVFDAVQADGVVFPTVDVKGFVGAGSIGEDFLGVADVGVAFFPIANELSVDFCLNAKGVHYAGIDFFLALIIRETSGDAFLLQFEVACGKVKSADFVSAFDLTAKNVFKSTASGPDLNEVFLKGGRWFLFRKSSEGRQVAFYRTADLGDDRRVFCK